MMNCAPENPDTAPELDAWGRRMAEDAAAGRLDALAEEALMEMHQGRTREL